MLMCQVSRKLTKGKEKPEDCDLSPPVPRKVGTVCRGSKEGANEEEDLALEPSSQGRLYISRHGNLVEYLFGASKQCEARDSYLTGRKSSSKNLEQCASVGSESGWQEICFSWGVGGRGLVLSR